MLKRFVLPAVALLSATTAAEAAVLTYNGTLTPNVTQLGFTPPVGNTGLDPSLWSYWQFSATAGEEFYIEVDRISGVLDPAAGVFAGTFTDTDDLLPFFDIYGGDAFGDDEDAPAVFGPYGDPNFYFQASMSGIYTLAIASMASGLDPQLLAFGYQVTLRPLNNNIGTPEPGMIGLLGLGLAGIAAARRRRKTA